MKFTITEEEKEALEKGYREGKKHNYRMRCLCLLLLAQGHDHRQVMAQTGMCLATVGNWLRRYRRLGFGGLCTRAGRGRPHILTPADGPLIRASVARYRQQLRAAQAEIERVTGKHFHTQTLRRYLKLVADATPASAAVLR